MAAKKRTNAYGSKTQFVVGLPFDMPARDVVAKGKQAGIQLTVPYVHKVRTMSKGSTKRRTSRAVGPSPRAGRPQRSSAKRDFVRGFPVGTPVGEILKHAEEAGLELSQAYVYAIRRQEAGLTRVRAAPEPRAAIRSRFEAPQQVELEQQFIDRVLDLGLVRSANILDSLRDRLLA